MSAQREISSLRTERQKAMSADAIARETQGVLQKMAGAISDSANKKETFARIAHVTGLTDGQVKRLFYGEWSVIPAHVYVRVRDAYRKFIEAAEKRARHEAEIYRALIKEWDDGIEL